MNPTVMNGLAIGLLVSFGMVIGIAVVFATLYRRHLRALRMTQRWVIHSRPSLVPVDPP